MPTPVVYDQAGTFDHTCAYTGVYTIEQWGAAQGGTDVTVGTGPGGVGGYYCSNTYHATIGDVLTINNGALGEDDTPAGDAGGDSSCLHGATTLVIAPGGASATSPVGSLQNAGGNGGAAGAGGGGGGGASGSAAGPGGNGQDGGATTGGDGGIPAGTPGGTGAKGCDAGHTTNGEAYDAQPWDDDQLAGLYGGGGAGGSILDTYYNGGGTAGGNGATIITPQSATGGLSVRRRLAAASF